jgi:hypothetical protein
METKYSIFFPFIKYFLYPVNWKIASGLLEIQHVGFDAKNTAFHFIGENINQEKIILIVQIPQLPEFNTGFLSHPCRGRLAAGKFLEPDRK